MRTRRQLHPFARRALPTLAMLMLACSEGSFYEPQLPPIVANVWSIDGDTSIVPGGWAYVNYDNFSDRTLRADRCHAWIERQEIGPSGTRWIQMHDARLTACGSDSVSVAAGSSVLRRLPAPAMAGAYRVRLDWRDEAGASVPMASPAFTVAAPGPLVMVILSERSTGTVPVQFRNLSTRSWRIDLCTKLRYERNWGPWGWVEVPLPSDPCTLVPTDLAPGTSIALDVPVWSTVAGRTRIRLGFVGPFGEVEVLTSGSFDTF